MITLSLPRVKSSLKKNQKKSRQSGKIVVVDDHSFVRTLIVDLMTLEGYQVSDFDYSVNIIEEISKIQPDLILLDVILFGADGFEICQKLKQNESTKLIPVIFTSASTEPKLRVKGKATGGSDFLNKPLNHLELSKKVKHCIAQKRLDESLREAQQAFLSLAEIIHSKRSLDNKNVSINLQNLAQEFGQYLKLSKEEIDYLKLAAHFHNIGLLKVADQILLKKTPLTKAEKELIQNHVLDGEKICVSWIKSQEILAIIRHHHERWDGKGYPDGLVGNEIPYLAQVFQIVDIYYALTCQRSYRRAFSKDEALQILLEEANEGWRNPQLVHDFYTFIKK